MTSIVLGVDPGLSGAVAALSSSGEYLGVADLPVARDASLGWIDGGELISVVGELRGSHRVMRVFVERVHAMPRNGTVGAFSQGATLGSLLAAVQCMGLPIELVTPGKWKKAMGLVHEKEDGDRVRKEKAANRARLLYPTAPLSRVRDHGRAEALLIATWGLSRLQGTPERDWSKWSGEGER